MSIKNFVSGVYVQRYQYKSFEPNKINKPWLIDDSVLQVALSKADSKLGELNAFSQLVPDIEYFIKMHGLKEATQSSKIEGTQTTIDDVLQKEEHVQFEYRHDWREVQNYIQATKTALDRMKTLPLSNRLLMETHKVLLQGVRGADKLPGEFRRSQNWIGGSGINDAVFIPPYHENLVDLMGDLESFLHNQNIPLPALIKIGIAHYQMETIHPFLDGNGRIGRLLITLFLVSNKLLSSSTLYLSDFFEKNRTLYYDNLMRARTHNDLLQWLKFFLEGVYQSSVSAIQTFKDIITLNNKVKEKLADFGRQRIQGRRLLEKLYQRPIMEVSDISEILEIDISTASRLARNFEELHILKERTGFSRNRIFIFEDYVNLFR